MVNPSRNIVKIVKQYCSERKISIDSFSQDWFFLLRQGERRHCVFAYDLGLNSSSALQIANDKSATHELLGHSGIPSVEHVIFLAEQDSSQGNWGRMLAYFAAHGRDIVCKPNIGTSGIGVHRVRSIAQLEGVSAKLFASNRALCLSPFLRLRRECRVVVLDGVCLLAYEKKIPVLLGDGRASLLELFLHRAAADEVPKTSFDDLAFIDQIGDLRRIPAAGETVPLGWTHNLAWGVRPQILDPEAVQPVVRLALAAAAALGIVFASVDVVETADGLAIIEVNAGVMMERFAQTSAAFYAIAEGIYRQALDRIFS